MYINIFDKTVGIIYITMLYSEIKPFIIILLQNLPYLEVVGSYARHENEINDVDLITMTPPINVILDLINKTRNLYDYDVKFIGGQNAKVSVKLNNGNTFDVDIWSASTPYEFKFLRWMRTMDKYHNIAYRRLAKSKHYTLSDRYMFDNKTKEFVDFKDVEDLKNFLKQ